MSCGVTGVCGGSVYAIVGTTPAPCRLSSSTSGVSECVRHASRDSTSATGSTDRRDVRCSLQRPTLADGDDSIDPRRFSDPRDSSLNGICWCDAVGPEMSHHLHSTQCPQQ